MVIRMRYARWGMITLSPPRNICQHHASLTISSLHEEHKNEPSYRKKSWALSHESINAGLAVDACQTFFRENLTSRIGWETQKKLSVQQFLQGLLFHVWKIREIKSHILHSKRALWTLSASVCCEMPAMFALAVITTVARTTVYLPDWNCVHAWVHCRVGRVEGRNHSF